MAAAIETSGLLGGLGGDNLDAERAGMTSASAASELALWASGFSWIGTPSTEVAASRWVRRSFAAAGDRGKPLAKG